MAPQIPRLALAFGLLIAGFLAFRAQVVPESFGKDGFYRSDFLTEIATYPVRHAGRDACATCHADKVEVTAHVKKGVGCESCHGPSAAHAEDFEKARPAKPGANVACGRCHAQISGRPKWFKQIDVKVHSGGEACRTCHTIHEAEAAQ